MAQNKTYRKQIEKQKSHLLVMKYKYKWTACSNQEAEIIRMDFFKDISELYAIFKTHTLLLRTKIS